MSFLASIFLGIVQGLTEFLPVSSSGHLVLFQKFLGIEQHLLTFDIAVHVGTLLSILTVYYKPLCEVVKEILNSLSNKKSKMTPSLKLFLLVCVGSLPTAFIGLLLKETFEKLFSNLTAVGVAFLFTGALLYVTRKYHRPSKNSGFFDLKFTEKMKYWQALLIGIAQGFAITPGVSRAGSTIAVGILLKMDWASAAFFSFILSIPAVLGATLLQFRDLDTLSMDWSPLLVGLVSSYIFGVLGLKVILKFIDNGRLHIFSYYLWALGLGLLAFQLYN